MSPKNTQSPLMRQYHALKEQVPGTLLFFRLGDFFEMFFDDAIIAARDLDITLTSRNKEQGEKIPMCGVPARSAEGYIARLVEKGHRVAVCEQVEAPQKGKTIVRREITRIVTPGTASDVGLLKAGENNYLAAVIQRADVTGFAYVDVSTGEFRMSEMAAADAAAAIAALQVREVLSPSAGPLFQTNLHANDHGNSNGRSSRQMHTEVEPWTFDHDCAERLLKDHYRLHSLDGLGVADHPAAVSAAGALLHYLRDTQRAALDHLDRPTWFRQQERMALDAVTVRNLEIVEPLFGGAKNSTLLHTIDQTRTAMGARLLRQQLLRPSLNREEIEARSGGVHELCGETITRTEVARELQSVADIERLLARVSLGSATPRDVASLGQSLRCIPMLRGLTQKLTSARMRQLLDRMDELADVRDRILTTLDESPPLAISDGGVIAKGFDPELDELREISQNSRGFIARLETQERENTGIGSLKIRHNNVFGFFIEVSKVNAHLVPDAYTRRQTLVNAERFITPELKEYESKVVEAEQLILTKEKTIFEGVRVATSAEAQRIRQVASAIAELDVLVGLAVVAAERKYVRPIFTDTGEIQIAGGRHPVIEALAEADGFDRFIPNDTYLNSSDHLCALITGPNMGGKSTYLRQVALTSILAQIGSFVPATAARLPIVDRVFTRIGASDNLAMGRSTFMVEMTETSEILNTATANSLILLDEVGRGTSTFDGLSIAWAVVEDICNRVGAKTLFATHYHELTELADTLDGVFNLHVGVQESGDRIVFVRKVEAGKASRSYGIEVARLAGLPLDVINRARLVLQMHEQREASVSEELAPAGSGAPLQVSIFDPNSALREEIVCLDIDNLKPIDALNLLTTWQQRIIDSAKVPS
jgi:DNA mismatch repair protein MutS